MWQKRQEVTVAGHGGDRELVERHLDDDDPMVRRLALGALHRLNALDAPRLRSAMADQSDQVVYRAIELAARSPHGPRLAPELIGFLNRDEFCEIAAFTLGELALDDEMLARAEVALSRQAVNHDDALAREAAVAALGALGVGLEAVLTGTADVAAVRRRAVLALVAFDDPRADRAMGDALTDRDWQVRQAAEDLVGPANPDDELTG